jgi:hypothetical protein
MRTRLCPFQRPSRPQPRKTHLNRGQVIVVFAVTLLALIFFAGLAIDSGSLYVTYGQLRRAIDAAAVAAANDYKAEGAGNVAPPLSRMKAAALEVMKLHNLKEINADGTPAMDLKVYVCDRDGDRVRDADLVTFAPEFFNICPDTTTDSARKLVWIDAQLKAPLYFLSLLGFRNVPLRAQAIAEAAPIDLVIVIDTSESMASETGGYGVGAFDPATCNAANNCEPLHSAKVAAKGLIDTLYDGYDHVAIVHYDVMAPATSAIPMREDLTLAKSDVDALQVHDDPPFTKLRPQWFYVHLDSNPTQALQGFNPVYPEDRDGNGLDSDPGAACTLTLPVNTAERWDATIDPFHLTEDGTPCDDASKFDSYDWDADGVYTDNDDTLARQWLLNHGCDLVNNPGACKPIWTYFTTNSTCTGCGIRVGAEVLKRDGRPNSVWVMVFLSDGLVNLSDTPTSNPDIPATFPNGFCNGGIGSYAWGNSCLDIDKGRHTIQVDANGDGDYTDPGDSVYQDFGNSRHCLDNPATTCPPGSVSALSDTTLYSVYDYALDMIDYAGLQKSANTSESAASGSDIAMYSIGLGDAGNTPSGASGPIGEYLLRYMAQIGDDGDRATDPCDGEPSETSCGQYYYSPSGAGLRAIFNEISTRIYSRLTK